ncbi:MAG: metallophosphoesterase [Chloroflexia bacterium]
MDLDLQTFLRDPLEGGAKVAGWLGRRWAAVIGVPAALGLLLVYLLPRIASRAGARGSARVLRQAGRQALGWSGLDLALTSGLPLLRLSYPPIRGAFFYLFSGRAMISAGAALPALAAALLGRDLPLWARRGLVGALWAAHGAAAAAEFYATYLGGQNLGASRHALDFPGRTPGAAPVRLRLAQLSDLHVERLTRREDAAVAMLRKLRPDLILLTGDFLSIDYYDVASYEALRELMTAIGGLAPPLGVYACLGNVDPPQLVATLLDGTGVRLLEDTAVTLPMEEQRVQILGAATSRGHRWEFDLPHFEAAVAAADAQGAADLRVLLYHTPDLAPQAAAAGVDLYLCGHTHGGQIRLPLLGALRTGSRFGRRYVIGLNRLPNGGYLYTNRGLGFEGMHLPRVRFLCPPEVAVFDVSLG